MKGSGTSTSAPLGRAETGRARSIWPPSNSPERRGATNSSADEHDRTTNTGRDRDCLRHATTNRRVITYLDTNRDGHQHPHSGIDIDARTSNGHELPQPYSNTDRVSHVNAYPHAITGHRGTGRGHGDHRTHHVLHGEVPRPADGSGAGELHLRLGAVGGWFRVRLRINVVRIRMAAILGPRTLRARTGGPYQGADLARGIRKRAPHRSSARTVQGPLTAVNNRRFG